ncbi:MAG: cellulase family glycosylhydrolase [Pseudomonadota bacterium]
MIPLRHLFLQGLKLILCFEKVFCAVFLLFIGMPSAFAGFSISGTQLLDNNGQPFIIRGVNHPHAWYTGQTSAIAHISSVGANTVRVVLSNGDKWVRNSQSDVANIIALCKQAQLICLLEVHDVTGAGEDLTAGTMQRAAQYWVDIKGALQDQEDYVLINVANEPTGNGLDINRWMTEQSLAIQTLRNAGLSHTLIIDAPNWGQDWENTMLRHASEVAQMDPLKNTMFSVHMYEVYQDYQKVNDYVTEFLNVHKLPLLIGEFGQDHQGFFVDADSIMRVAEQNQVGYLGWSWSGNGDCCRALDIVNNFNPESLTVWGERLIHGVHGIAATSHKATVYTGVINPPPTNGGGNDNVTDNPVIPGKIEAEDYARFFDTTLGNTGQSYRAENVDIEATTDLGLGYNLGWIAEGEWLEYDFTVTNTADYIIDIRLASAIGGGRFNVFIDGQQLGNTLPVGMTGSWQSWITIPSDKITLSAGEHVLRVEILSGNFNINWFEFKESEIVLPPNTSTIDESNSCKKQCQWYTDAPRPLCTSQDTGWGWENNQTCIGKTLCEEGQFGVGGVIKVCQ